MADKKENQSKRKHSSSSTTSDSSLAGNRRVRETPYQDIARIRRNILAMKEAKGALSPDDFYKDPSFTSDMTSLAYVYSGDDKYEKAIFKRPRELHEDPVFVGVGGICDEPFPWRHWKQRHWLHAALVAVSLSVRHMEKIVPGYKNFEQGFNKENYTGAFHFNIWRFGEWIDIVVDDRLPMLDDHHLFCGPLGSAKELWGPLVEKSYAKCKKTYQSIEYGGTLDALTDLTGAVCEHFTPDVRPPRILFRILYKSHMARSQMVCWRNEKRLTSNGFTADGENQESQTQRYLHVITAVTKFPTTDGRVVEMVRLKCPFSAEPTWRGRFSDRDFTSWESVNRDFRHRLQPLTKKDDDEYWMSMDDFRCNFGGLFVISSTEPFRVDGLSLARSYHLQDGWDYHTTFLTGDFPSPTSSGSGASPTAATGPSHGLYNSNHHHHHGNNNHHHHHHHHHRFFRRGSTPRPEDCDSGLLDSEALDLAKRRTSHASLFSTSTSHNTGPFHPPRHLHHYHLYHHHHLHGGGGGGGGVKKKDPKRQAVPADDETSGDTQSLFVKTNALDKAKILGGGGRRGEPLEMAALQQQPSLGVSMVPPKKSGFFCRSPLQHRGLPKSTDRRKSSDLQRLAFAQNEAKRMGASLKNVLQSGLVNVRQSFDCKTDTDSDYYYDSSATDDSPDVDKTAFNFYVAAAAASSPSGHNNNHNTNNKNAYSSVSPPPVSPKPTPGRIAQCFEGIVKNAPRRRLSSSDQSDTSVFSSSPPGKPSIYDKPAKPVPSPKPILKSPPPAGPCPKTPSPKLGPKSPKSPKPLPRSPKPLPRSPKSPAKYSPKPRSPKPRSPKPRSPKPSQREARGPVSSPNLARKLTSTNQVATVIGKASPPVPHKQRSASVVGSCSSSSSHSPKSGLSPPVTPPPLSPKPRMASPPFATSPPRSPKTAATPPPSYASPPRSPKPGAAPPAYSTLPIKAAKPAGVSSPPAKSSKSSSLSPPFTPPPKSPKPYCHRQHRAVSPSPQRSEVGGGNSRANYHLHHGQASSREILKSPDIFTVGGSGRDNRERDRSRKRLSVPGFSGSGVGSDLGLDLYVPHPAAPPSSPATGSAPSRHSEPIDLDSLFSGRRGQRMQESHSGGGGGGGGGGSGGGSPDARGGWLVSRSVGAELVVTGATTTSSSTDAVDGGVLLLSSPPKSPRPAAFAPASVSPLASSPSSSSSIAAAAALTPTDPAPSDPAAACTSPDGEGSSSSPEEFFFHPMVQHPPPPPAPAPKGLVSRDSPTSSQLPSPMGGGGGGGNGGQVLAGLHHQQHHPDLQQVARRNVRSASSNSDTDSTHSSSEIFLHFNKHGASTAVDRGKGENGRGNGSYSTGAGSRRKSNGGSLPEMGEEEEEDDEEDGELKDNGCLIPSPSEGKRPSSAPQSSSGLSRHVSSGSLSSLTQGHFRATKADYFRSDGCWRLVLAVYDKWTRDKPCSCRSNLDLHSRSQRHHFHVSRPEHVDEVSTPDLQGKRHVIVSLLQDYRHGANTANSLLVPIGFCVYKCKGAERDDKRHISRFQLVDTVLGEAEMREVTARLDLEHGSYFLVPFHRTEGHTGEYMVRVLTEDCPHTKAGCRVS